jgi:peptide/nickel transport system substrate-binding protein
MKDLATQSGIDRRRMLQTLGGAGLIGLAGCSGQQDGQGNGQQNNSGSGDGNAPVDSTFNTAGLVKVPKNIQYNPFNSTNWSYNLEPYVYEQLAQYDPANGEFVPRVATNWSVNDQSATVELSGNYTWHNGDAVVAEDVITEMKIDVYNALWEFTSEITAPDDQTIQFELTNSVNPDVFNELVLTTRINAPRHHFDRWRKKIENASSEKERQKIFGEVQTWNLEEPTGNGPFQVENQSQSKLVASIHGKNPSADKINFDKLVMKYSDGDNGKQQALLSDNADGMRVFGAPPSVVDKLPEHIRPYFINIYAGRALYFQQNKKPLQKRKVRQAIAYLLDRKQMTNNIPAPQKQYQPVKIPSNIAGQATGNVDQWLSDVNDAFDRYDQNEKRATSLLQEAGLSKQGGNWIDSSGNPFSLKLKGPSGWSDDTAILQTASDRLDQFGINTSLSSVEQTTYFGNTVPNGDYDIATSWWGSIGQVNPYFAMGSILGADSDLHTGAHYPYEVSIPTPIGNPSDSKSFDLREKITKIATSKQKKQARQHIQELAWLINQDVPILPICEKSNMGALSNDDWNIPSADAPVMQIDSPTHWLPRVGKLTAKTK